MNRFVTTAGVFFVIFCVIYSGLWFYQSSKVKDYTEHVLLALTKNFGGPHSEFAYSSSDISGFPFGYRVSVSKPRFIIDDQDISMEVFSEQDLVVESNIFGTRYYVSMPKEVRVHNVTGANNLLLRYQDDAQLYVKARLRAGDIMQWVWDRTAADEKVAFDFREIEYKDDGYSLIDTGDLSEVASVGSSYINIEHDSSDIYDVKIDIEDQFISWLDSFANENEELGKIKLQGQFSFSGAQQPQGETVIDEFKLTSDIFSFGLKGSLANNQDESLPFGDMQVKIGNYENFIDYQSSLINYVVQNSAFPIFRIKKRQATAFKAFLAEVASERYNEDKDILLLVKREQGNDISIGQYNFPQAVLIYKQAAAGRLGKKVSNKKAVPALAN